MENKEFFEQLLDQMIDSNISEGVLEKSGASIYEKDISFSKLAIVLDKFAFSLEDHDKALYKNHLNRLAKGYIQKRLPLEIKTIKLGIHNNPNFVTQKDVAIIDELLVWMEELVQSFINHTPPPHIEDRIAEFTAFIENRIGIYFDNVIVKEDFLRTNKALYECASEAVVFFDQEEFYYFTLIYIELIALFLKMVTLLSGMFLEENLLSIYIDPITLLPNRFQLLKDVENFQNVYILIVNIKAFSKLNISYGYDIGDGILKKIASFLKLSNAIKSYRIYADEFAIILPSKKDVYQLFDALNDSLSYEVSDTERFDIFFYGAYDKFVARALESCEFALAKSKKIALIGTDEIKSMQDDFKYELTMMQKLKTIMIEDSIAPYFQPIYAQKPDHKIIKYEVLMRLDYKGELLAPYEFMDVLHQAPFYTEFTKSMLLKSFEMFKDNEYTFSVNFTVTDIMDKSIRLFLETLIAKYPQTAQRLTIEITEAEALKDFELLNEFIHNFKQKGITFSLDDFGSGYSNFAQFAKLDIDFIKIDGSIVEQILEDEKMQKIVDSILRFTESMDLKVIAEFVSTKEIFDYLKDKVDMLQGYYIGKPQPYLV